MEGYIHIFSAFSPCVTGGAFAGNAAVTFVLWSGDKIKMAISDFFI